MSIEQQIAANEQTFQEWFQRSWDAHQKENPSATDFKDVGDPRPKTLQKSYAYLEKRTVRVMAGFQSRPDDFVQHLQDYLINNALLLYQESIRIANLPGSVSFYKNCGDQVGMVECHLSREGQLVTVSVGYQTYKKSIELLNNLSAIEIGASSKDDVIVIELHKKSKKPIRHAVYAWILVTFLLFISATICFGACYKSEFASVIGFLLFFTGIGFSWGTLFNFFSFFDMISEAFKNRDAARYKANLHLSYDLSHTFFPVAYYSNDEVTAGQSQNKDHAVFLERICSVVDRAVAFGESSHNQRA